MTEKYPDVIQAPSRAEGPGVCPRDVTDAVPTSFPGPMDLVAFEHWIHRDEMGVGGLEICS